MDQDRGSSVNIPWMVLGDFNSVTSPKEKEFGADVTAYETRDINECFISLGMVDMVSVGCFFTWTKNSIWCKLDRVMVKSEIYGQTHFLPAGCLSDHSPSVVTLFHPEDHFHSSTCGRHIRSSYKGYKLNGIRGALNNSRWVWSWNRLRGRWKH